MRTFRSMLVKKVFFLLLFLTSQAYCLQNNNDLSYTAIEKRLAPEGQVDIAGQKNVVEAQVIDAAVPDRSGQEVYNQYCVVCHGSGMAGSPKFGCAKAWAPHRAKEIKQKGILLQHALQGFNFMPPKGTCVDCSNGEIEEAIQYMLNHSMGDQC